MLFLSRLTCSVVLWRGKEAANKYHWYVWGVLTVDGPHWVCCSPGWCALLKSTLLRFQGALQGHCSKCTLLFVHFPGLNSSGNWVLGEHTVPGGLCILCTSLVLADQFPGCTHEGTVSGVLCVSSGDLISGCETPARYLSSRIPGRGA